MEKERLLMTASLLGSWDWFMNSNEEYARKALMDFVSTLKREDRPTSEPARQGLEFEKDVEKACVGSFPPSDKEARYNMVLAEAAEICRGGAWQVKGSVELEVDGQPFLLYGRMDVLKGPRIIDLKWKMNESTYEVGNYFGYEQVAAYFRIFEGPTHFLLLTSGGYNLYREEYRRDETGPIESSIYDFWKWMGNYPDLLSLYLKNWGAKKRDIAVPAVGPALTWDELANLFDKKKSGNRPARTLPMDTVYDWAISQPDRFFLDKKNDTLHLKGGQT